MRGLNLLLRRPPRCFARSRTALTLVEVPHPAMFGKHWRVDSFARFSPGLAPDKYASTTKQAVCRARTNCGTWS